jgi:hypothetical protein
LINNKTHLDNTNDDKRWGKNKNIKMPTRNNKMAINNSRDVGNTKGVRLDMIFLFFKQ